ncbi:hypothetical protein GCM10017687_14280 [Streptomyces echinatus]
MAEAETLGGSGGPRLQRPRQAHVLVREKHATEAVTLVRHTADQLTGSYDRRSPESTSPLSDCCSCAE